MAMFPKDNPVGDIRAFLSGIFSMMLVGMVVLPVMFLLSKGDPGVVFLALAIFLALLNGYGAVTRLWHFVSTAPDVANAASLAIVTSLFAMLGGGLAGFVIMAIARERGLTL